VQDVLEERFTDITGLDRVHIAPYVSRATGEVTPRVSVSKNLVGEKMFVTFTSSLGTEAEQEIILEYLLTDNVSVLGGQDYSGSIGGDLKFRFRFK
jgi:hypothetical protein